MKILILFIYSQDNVYNKMLENQRKYVHSDVNIESYFVTLDENLNCDIKLENDIIYVKGKESFINILYKTIKALDYLINTLNKSYDFVIRSNISTIINFNKLCQYLEKSPKTMFFSGGLRSQLLWTLGPRDICETKQHERSNYYGLIYVQGISIILSCDVVNVILKNEKSIVYDIVDDVKLALIIKKILPDVYTYFTDLKSELLADVSINEFSNNSVFIRNKRGNRHYDADIMNDYINKLYVL